MSFTKKSLTLFMTLIMAVSILAIVAPSEGLLNAAALESVSGSDASAVLTDKPACKLRETNEQLPRLSADVVYANHEVFIADGFRYVVKSGNVIIIGSETVVEGTLSIPSEIDGMTVTAIGDYAFAGCKGISSVELPKSVVSVGNGAFRGCESLARINLDYDHVFVGTDAFSGCAEVIVVDESIFGKVTAIGTTVKSSGYKPTAGQNVQTASNDWYIQYPAAMLNALKNGMLKHQSVDISAYNVSVENVSDIITALEIEYPIEFAALDSGSYRYSYNANDMLLYTLYLEPGYSDTATVSTTTSRYNQLKAVVEPFVEEHADDSDYEKVLYAHDFIVLSGDYDWNYEKYGAYDILIDGTAVCQGYTDALKMLLNLLDVPVLAAESDAMWHTWNIVRLDNKWYHIDATWNDIEDEYYYYIYYLLNDTEIEESDHYDWYAPYTCTSTSFSNFPRTYCTNCKYYAGQWYIADYSVDMIYTCDIYGNVVEIVVTDAYAYPGLVICNNILYYADGDTVKYIGLSTGKTGSVYTITQSEKSECYYNASTYADFLISDKGILSYTLSVYSPTYESYISIDGHSTIDIGDNHDFVLSVPTLEAHSVGYTSAKLTWTGLSNDAHGYSIYRCDRAGQPYNYVDYVEGSDKNTYTNIGLSTGTTYYYKVRAYANLANGQKIYSGYSNYHTARPLPATPVVSTVRLSNTSAAVTWVRIYGATGYSVYRSTEKDGTYSFLAGISSGDTVSYIDKSVKSGQTYYYKVRAYRQMGSDMMFSNYSKSVTASSTAAIPSITARSVGYTSAKVVWETIPNVDGYSIYRCDVGGGTYSYIATVGKDVTTYTNTGLSTGTTYYYKVRAFINSGSDKIFTAYSACATARPIPATPVVTVTTDSANNATISWVRIYGATGYSVYRSTEEDGTYTFLAGISSGDTVTYTDKNLDEDVTYYYKVRAYRAMGSDKMFSNYSLPVCSK